MRASPAEPRVHTQMHTLTEQEREGRTEEGSEGGREGAGEGGRERECPRG